MNVKATKVPDKPKGLLASQCMAKKKNNATNTSCCLNLAFRLKCARVINTTDLGLTFHFNVMKMKQVLIFLFYTWLLYCWCVKQIKINNKIRVNRKIHEKRIDAM